MPGAYAESQTPEDGSPKKSGCTLVVLEFILTALLWGGGALMTAFQVGSVPAPVSVGYRMTLVGLAMLGAGAVAGRRLRLAREDALWVILQGVLFFGLAFIAFYSATQFIPSGLAALILSMSSVFAALLARAFLGVSLSARVVVGLLCGILGLAIVVGPDLPRMLGESRVIVGSAWALLSALATAGGTVIAARNQRRQVPMLSVMGWGACTGAVVAFAWSLAAGLPFRVDTSLQYLGSLAYLAVFASGVAFALYFDLVRQIGPARSAYTLAVVPVIALVLSALFEGLVLETRILAGAGAILAGNILVLSKRSPAERPSGHT
jgi:drug/metabolite transporter (DMT)-like permease